VLRQPRIHIGKKDLPAVADFAFWKIVPTARGLFLMRSEA